ncbi:GGDEF domain-containing protein [Cellulophaga sp. HaHa_2_1]|uniref:GGDEF domain-containing protein n=1 Tax=Cellulophaga sp. HaHa_2_1 TaxID=2749994 RepID=UPI001C4E4A28|nr:GGDEF domain-containing protein [Cellulophaga sp. HaHa_2_1]QXP52545.1 GGDEF domain-containing protein [Cellulophaga sp. HaHa_2_1]
MNYLKESFTKFKKDLFSKSLYDIIKYLVIISITIIISRFIPVIKEIFQIELKNTIWTMSLIIVYTMIFSFFITTLILSKTYKKILIENNTDELTGLKNYKALKKDFDKIILDQNQDNLPISLILIDIDNFKKFNDENTYQIADNILKKLGNLLNEDSRITDETYRYFNRGDEFLIVAKKTNLQNAKLASDRKRSLIKDATFSIEQKDFKLTVCCSVTELKFDENKELAIERLNKGMQNAKKHKEKNRTEVIV